MIDIADKNYQPSIQELVSYTETPLFSKMLEYLQANYSAKVSVQYSGDNILLGWNVKVEKAGRALCRLYPRKNFFHFLVVVGKKEKPRVEAIMPAMSEKMQELYNKTSEGMGQRWLVSSLTDDDAFYQDVLQLIRIRRESK